MQTIKRLLPLLINTKRGFYCLLGLIFLAVISPAVVSNAWGIAREKRQHSFCQLHRCAITTKVRTYNANRSDPFGFGHPLSMGPGQMAKVCPNLTGIVRINPCEGNDCSNLPYFAVFYSCPQCVKAYNAWLKGSGEVHWREFSVKPL